MSKQIQSLCESSGHDTLLNLFLRGYVTFFYFNLVPFSLPLGAIGRQAILIPAVYVTDLAPSL